MEENRKLVQVRSTISAFLLFLSIFLMQIVAAIVGSIISLGMGIDPDPRNKTYIIFLSMLSALFSLAWCGYRYQRFRFHDEDFSYREAFAGAKIPAIIGIGVGGCVSISILLTLLQQVFPSWFQNYQNVMSNFTQGSQVLTMLYALLIGPVSEEVIFRGAILNRLFLGFSFWVANFLQAALFGIYHMNLVQGIYAFVLGYVLGLVWLMTKTVLASIGAHILFNMTNVMLQHFFPENAPISVSIICIIFLLSILFFIAGLWYTVRKCFIEEKTTSDTIN